MQKSRRAFALALAAASAAFPLTGSASDWRGLDGLWSNNATVVAAGDAGGWNGTGVPNAIGATANFSTTASNAAATTTVDDGVTYTVGTLSYTGTANRGRTIAIPNAVPNTGLILNQDGAGSGTATISNANSGAVANNFVLINGAGTMTLNDNLLVTNTGASTSASGAIRLDAIIAGTGNITFSNVSNSVTASNAYAGGIRVFAANTFTGSVLVQKGAVVFNDPLAFGGAGNTITLGQAAGGSATLMSTSATADLANPVVVAAGSGGTLMLGTASTGSANYTGTITLNGNLTYNSLSTNANGSAMTGVVSGAGSITKIGTGIARLTNSNNSFLGGVFVNEGSLIAGGNKSLGTGDVTLAAGTMLTLNATVTNAISNTATLTLNGANDATAAKLNLLATTGVLQETIGSLVLNGVQQPAGTYGATGSGAMNINDNYFSGGGILTVAVPEPSTYALVASAGLVLLALRRRAAVRRANGGA